MRLIRSTDELEENFLCTLAIGKFDGLHSEHVNIIKKVISKSDELSRDGENVRSVVLTFEPSSVLRDISGTDRLLTTSSEKTIILDELGVDVEFEQEFTEEFKNIEPEEFIKTFIVDEFHAKYVCVGEDFRFGKEGRGNVDLLKKLGEEYGFKTDIVKLKFLDDDCICSSLIRKKLAENEIESVNNLLGHGYYIIGRVKNGKKLGRKMGFPTINLYPEKDKALPGFGVYASKIHINNKKYHAVTNIGIRPTVDYERDDVVSVESFIIDDDFNVDCYNELVTVELEKFIRTERKFSSLDGLIMQIDKDIETAKEIFEN